MAKGRSGGLCLFEDRIEVRSLSQTFDKSLRVPDRKVKEAIVGADADKQITFHAMIFAPGMLLCVDM